MVSDDVTLGASQHSGVTRGMVEIQVAAAESQ